MRNRIVGEVMTREVVRAGPRTSFGRLARLLETHRISGLPIVDPDDKVVGVVSRTDLMGERATRGGRGRMLRLLPARLRAGRAGRSGRTGTAAARTGTAQELMSTPAITVHPEQSVADAARVMERRRVDRLPVVDEEDRLIGIATRRDLLRIFLRGDEEIQAEITGWMSAGDPRAVPEGASGTDGVRVRVRDGLVSLEGVVGSAGAVSSAVGCAWRVDGVVGVVSRLTVRADGHRTAGGR
ncbi:MAG TPA: CBS domain-containing protein [Streptomyces sp.]|nr:CBS domain-containing protein [Streptomyces sp.]